MSEEEEKEDKTEVIPGPKTSVEEMQNAIFNYVMTLTRFYMEHHFMSREQASSLTADLLEGYVIALRELKDN